MGEYEADYEALIDDPAWRFVHESLWEAELAGVPWGPEGGNEP